MRLLLFSLPHSFTGLSSANWYRGLPQCFGSGRVLPVVDPRGFLSAEDLDAFVEPSPWERPRKRRRISGNCNEL